MLCKHLAIPVLTFTFCSVVFATDEGSFATDDAQYFESSVVPILKDNCLRCHAGQAPKGGLLLTSRDGILQGGDSGSAVDLKNHSESVLLQAVNYDGYEMPPTGQMSPAQITILTTWVEKGLPWSNDFHEIEFEVEKGPPPVNETTKAFWSFQRVKPVEVPSVEFGHNPIDAFLEKQRIDAGVTAVPSTTARSLIRRAHYSLLGLPPEAEFVNEWAVRLGNGKSLNQTAVREMIDVLLESPHYGEHWGRHWLDLVRYAETNSYERDGAKPYVWRYRDYVIQAFNQDKPYNEFVVEQLAGDELAEPTADSIVATGYYRLGRWDDEPADRKLAFYDDVDDIVTTTSQTYLGLTVNCARCHDHKIDPIPQADYYRMVAFFRYLRRFGDRSHESVLAASVREIDRPADARTYQAAMKRHDNDVADAVKKMKRIEKIVLPDFQDVEKEDYQYDMNKLPLVQKRVGKLIDDRQFNIYKTQFNRLKGLEANKPSGLAAALCVKEDYSVAKPTFILTRGNPHAEATEVTPGFPSVLSPPEPDLTEASPGSESSGRRMALAQWIASDDNPLTSRVMVNRIWQFHFGRGIVRTPSDFGFQGSAPTHPELLDWLAQRFVEDGWSIKDMHRLIMSSAAYQMASSSDKTAYQIDPVNDLFWKFDMRRLSAEEVRDTILWVNQSLNAGKMYGPSIYTDIPDEVKAGQSRPGSGWGNSSAEDKVRRSVYIHVKRSLLDPLLESFDFADTDQTCPVRFVTTQPTQALGMLNSDFMQQQARLFADSLASFSDSRSKVKAALQRVTQRDPTESEIQRGSELMVSLKTDHGLSQEQALQYFCLVALNLNEMMYLD